MKQFGKIILLAHAILAFTPASRAFTNLPPSPIRQVFGGGRHTMALLWDGSVWTWGSDVSGKLGDNHVSPSYSNTLNDSFIPLRVHGPGNVGYLDSITAISAGEGHNLALRADGTVWAWGWNAYGQLGNGTTNDAYTPTQVSNLANVVAISGRGYHCLALKSDGTVWAWGWNQYGQLGINSAATNLAPVRVQGLTNPAAISAGYTTSLALMSNGTVQMWGTGRKQELGQGTGGASFSYLPIPVPGLSDVVSVSDGFQEPEALKSDGTIWMWGWNNLGELGNSTTNDTNFPTQVTNLTNMIFAGVTGDRDNCALAADHTIWIWGRNYNGQLGLGTVDQDPHPLPVQIPPFGNGQVTMVQTPDWHSLALESDGTLWGWGANDHGQLGNNTTNDSCSPTPVLWPQAAIAPASAITLAGAGRLADGSFQFAFTNTPGAQFTVLAASSPTLPLTNWMALGAVVTEVSPGHFQFTDATIVGGSPRFYRVRAP